MATQSARERARALKALGLTETQWVAILAQFGVTGGGTPTPNPTPVPSPTLAMQGIPNAGWQVGVARQLSQATVAMTNISQAFLALHNGNAQVGARQPFTDSASLAALSVTPQTANSISALQAWTAATGGTMLDSDPLGTIAAGTGGTPGTATGFTVSVQIATGITGNATVVSYAPSPAGSLWPAGAVLTPNSSVGGDAFTPATRTLGANGNPVTFSSTPATNGARTFNGTATQGLVSTGGAQYTAVAAPTPGSAPPAFTDFQWLQSEPAHPLMGEGGGGINGGFGCRLGRFKGVDGVGPYRYEITSETNGKYTLSDIDHLFNFYTLLGPQPDNLTVRCTDGLGRQVTKVITVAKRADSSAWIFISAIGSGDDNITSEFYEESWTPRVFGASAPVPEAAITVNDPAGVWELSYGSLHTKGQVRPTPGSYPVTFSAAVPGGGTITRAYTIVIAPVPAVSRLYFVPVDPVSTSMLAGNVAGRLAATTSPNAPAFEIIGAAAEYLFAEAATGIVRVKKTLPLGPLLLDGKVTDRLQTRTESHVLNVVQGTVLPSTNMSLTPNAGLINHGFGQTVGTPTVTGVTGTKSWTISYRGQNYRGPYYPGPPIVINPTTGAITAPGMLGAKVHQLTVTCTDGINTCTRTFPVTVNWAPQGRTIHVGRGMKALHGADGYERYRDLMPDLQYHLSGSNINATVLFYADSDPNWHIISGDYFSRKGIKGPIKFRNANPNGPRPRVGGIVEAGAGGNDEQAKGGILISDGDFEITGFEVSYCNGYSSPEYNNSGVSGIRKDGDTYGNVIIQDNWLHNNSNNIKGGGGPGDWIIRRNVLFNGGTEYVGSGPSHNVYLNDEEDVLFEDNLSMRSNSGHCFKARCVSGTIRGNRIYDGERGSASALIDIPSGGDWLVEDNDLMKGPNCLNGAACQFATEYNTPYRGQNRPNKFVARGNTISLLVPQFFRFGPATAFWHIRAVGSDGLVGEATLENNSYFATAGNIRFRQWDQVANPGNTQSSASPIFTETGAITLAMPPALDFSDPSTYGATFPAARPSWLNHQTTNGGDQEFFHEVQIDPGLDDIRVQRAFTGRILDNIRAYGMPAAKSWDPPRLDLVNPFGPGTTWSFVANGEYSSPSSPWASVLHPGRYVLTSNADGTATLDAPAARPAGVDFIKLQAQKGTAKCHMRFYLVNLPESGETVTPTPAPTATPTPTPGPTPAPTPTPTPTPGPTPSPTPTPPSIGNGARAMVLDGSGMGYASTPHLAAYNPQYDIDVRVKVSAPSWTGGDASGRLVDHWDGSKGFLFLLNSDGTLGWVSLTGTFNNVKSSASLSVPTNSDVWLRAAIDGTPTATTLATMRCYTSVDNETSWQQLGIDVVIYDGAMNHPTAEPLRIGNNTAENSPGPGLKIKAARILTDAGTVFEADFSTLTPGATNFIANTEQSVTINSPAVIA